MIIIVDYGMGNLHSILNMLEYLEYDAEISRDPTLIASANHLILPGVGTFDKAMRNLKDLNLIPAMEEAALNRRVPVLGVCLGMQLLGKSSEEGGEATGLGWINASTHRFQLSPGSKLKIPHIGWSNVAWQEGNSLFLPSNGPSKFYFVHSYQMRCADESAIAATCHHENEFCCAVSKDNVHGVQFHPEKSHRHGMALLQAFMEKA